MKILATVFIVIVSCFSATAQQKWSEGVVVLSSGEVKVGQLRYHPRWDAVTFREGGAVQTFPVAKLSQFRFFDQEIQVWRKFYPYKKDEQHFQRLAFYEVIFRGEYALLRRKKSVEPVWRNNGRYEAITSASDQLMWEQVAGYDYYFKHGEDIVPLAGFKSYTKELTAFEELEVFSRTHHLSWRNSHDIVLMLNYLNCSVGSGCRQDLLLTTMMASN